MKNLILVLICSLFSISLIVPKDNISKERKSLATSVKTADTCIISEQKEKFDTLCAKLESEVQKTKRNKKRKKEYELRIHDIQGRNSNLDTCSISTVSYR